MKLLFENWRKYLNEVNSAAQDMIDDIARHKGIKPRQARDPHEIAAELGYKSNTAPVLTKNEIEELIGGPEFSFNSLQSSYHRWGTQRPKIDYYHDEPSNNWKYLAYTSNNPDKPDLESMENETLEDFLGRVRDYPLQMGLKFESLYYGTSTVFQKEITENGIRSPSIWGDYGSAEQNAMNIVDQVGGEPMVIHMPTSEFENKSLTLQENDDKMYIYKDKLIINIEKQNKINL
jgi:hypothetical protein